MSTSFTIPLTRGQVALVDPEDFERFGHLKWTFGGKRSTYAYRMEKDENGVYRRNVLLHRAILGAQKGQFVDHINGDTLDNRRSNLRLCTSVENSRNRRSVRADGLIGIYRHNSGWTGRVKAGKVLRQTRTYPCPILAAAARDVLAQQHFGEFARLNFQFIPVSPVADVLEVAA